MKAEDESAEDESSWKMNISYLRALMKANSQKQRCLALRYDLLECFALLVMECCYSL